MLIKRSLLYLTIFGNSLVNAVSESDAVESSREKREARELYDEQGGRTFVVQGDIFLTREEASNRYKRQAQRRNASNENLWVDGVPYVFDPRASDELKKGFVLAAKAWEKDTCIDFKQVATKGQVEGKDYLYVTYDETDPHGCISHVGKLGGNQPLYLGKGCEAFPHAAHEVGHALGLYHTQNRHDRDQYIKLNMERIKEDNHVEQFVELTQEQNENYGLPYDYGSIMHYGSSIQDARITPKDEKYKTTMGSPLISFIDLLMINKHYNCTDKCDPDSSARCENGGFPHPRNCSECICPGGYGGTLCNERPNDCKQGKEVKALSYFQQLNPYVSKENNDGSYVTCTYWITAPEGKRIEISIEAINSKDPSIGCASGGIEVKANANHTLTGYRYCVDPDDELVIKSHSNLVPIILYSGVPLFWTRAEMQYRYVDADS